MKKTIGHKDMTKPLLETLEKGDNRNTRYKEATAVYLKLRNKHKRTKREEDIINKMAEIREEEKQSLTELEEKIIVLSETLYGEFYDIEITSHHIILHTLTPKLNK